MSALTTEHLSTATAALTLTPDASIPPTIRHYLIYEGNFQHTCTATVLSSMQRPTEGSNDVEVELIFNETIFHPQGGGQPSDLGVIVNERNGVEVTIVKVSFSFVDNIVTHLCRVSSSTPIEDASELFKINDVCKLQVDAEKRHEFSLCHSAGHLVDSAMYRSGCILPSTKGYHFLDTPYVEYKGIIEVDKRADLVVRLKEHFEALVSEDIPTTICMLTKPEAAVECTQTPDMSNISDPTVRVVGIGGFRCLCGGTHVRKTGELGGYTVDGLTCKKGMVKVKYRKKV